MKKPLRHALLVLCTTLTVLIGTGLADPGPAAHAIAHEETDPSVASSGTFPLDTKRPLTAEEMINAIPLDPPVGLPAIAERSPSLSKTAEQPVVGSHPVEPKVKKGSVQILSYFNAQIGRVFVRRTGSELVGFCSASAINSEGKNMVLTAGHCNYYGGSWNIGADVSWIFVPGYQNGNAPYGQWQAKLLVTTNQWFNNYDYNNDVGLALMYPLNGRNLVNVVGGLGVTWGQPELGQFTVQGYPAEPPFDGSGQYFCTGSSQHWGTNQIQMPCNMTRGVSGSPWLRGYDTSSGYANGVASTIDRIVNPTLVTSPYFSSQNIGTIYNEHRNG